MATSTAIKGFLRTATLDMALLQLDHTRRVTSEARTALVGILAVDVAGLIGLVAVVATIAASGHLPPRWWVPGAPLIVSLGIAVSGVRPRRQLLHHLDYAVVAGKALGAASDRAALDTLYAAIDTASRHELRTLDRLYRRAALSIGLLLLSLALTLVPIGIEFPKVFPP
ncbi:MAG TPA: hypothetical protein VN193_14160 [Candidatus Angelobacter sp.]|nr:hypothetical protein [Candidatus Angelobacter sp.]